MIQQIVSFAVGWVLAVRSLLRKLTRRVAIGVSLWQDGGCWLCARDTAVAVWYALLGPTGVSIERCIVGLSVAVTRTAVAHGECS